MPKPLEPERLGWTGVGRSHLRLIVRGERGLRLAKVRRDHADHGRPMHLRQAGCSCSASHRSDTCSVRWDDRDIVTADERWALGTGCEAAGQRTLLAARALFAGATSAGRDEGGTQRLSTVCGGARGA